ncbi:MAG: hypothetical protein MUO97_05520 [Dehalococcoidia bacterium]|nr:hypothetical protein [Dehalococcoidia bacterium]
MKKWIPFMKKSIPFIITFVVFVVILFLPVSCASHKDIIRSEAVGVLTLLNVKGITKVDDDIAKIDQRLYDTEEKIAKLEQVLAPALKWVEYQKTLNYEGRYGWNKHVTQEGLDKLKNDQYQIVTLESVATLDSSGTGWKFSSNIRVKDLKTLETYNPDVINNELKQLKDNLNQRMQEKLDTRALSLATLKSVLGSAKDWEIQKINDNTYRLSGPGLGWAEKLTTGQWIYQRDKKEMAPASESSIALEDILSAKR